MDVVRLQSISWPLYNIPAIRVAGRFPFSPQISSQTFCHPTYALHQHHYRGTIVIGKKRFDLSPGDLTITPPNTISRYTVAETSHHWCIHFTPPHTTGDERCARLPLYLAIGTRGELISERFRAIAEIFSRGGAGSAAKRECARAEAGAMLLSFLLKLPTIVPEPSKRAYSRRSDAAIEAIRQTLDLNFQHPLSPADLARDSGLSRNYFAVRFQAIFGLTVQAYLLKRRIELARNLLLSSDLPVKQVAFECGIHDPHYFNKQFRRATGVSPTEYRDRAGNVW